MKFIFITNLYSSKNLGEWRYYVTAAMEIKTIGIKDLFKYDPLHISLCFPAVGVYRERALESSPVLDSIFLYHSGFFCENGIEIYLCYDNESIWSIDIHYPEPLVLEAPKDDFSGKFICPPEKVAKEFTKWFKKKYL